MKRRSLALITGWSLVLMAITAGFSYGYVYNELVIPEDPNTTIFKIQLADSVFQLGLAGWVLIAILDLNITWSLYQYFKVIHQKLSFNAALLRLIYTLFLIIAVFHLFKILLIGEKSLDLVSYHMMRFSIWWGWGLVIFGVHLIGIGLLAIRDSSIPRIFGLLLILAGLSYFILEGLKVNTDPNPQWLETLETVLMFPMAIGELGFAVWLLVKGGKAIQT